MSAPRSSEISRTLGPLRDVVQSLTQARDGVVPSGIDRQRLVRRVRSAGSAAVPALMRALASDHEAEAGWAYHLLTRLGGARVSR
jgi:hypothetical protein